jgi:hypothetical protein
VRPWSESCAQAITSREGQAHFLGVVRRLTGCPTSGPQRTGEPQALAMELIAARLQAREAEERAKRIHKSLELKKSQAAEVRACVLTCIYMCACGCV